jgi:hypothetical protein
MEPEYLESMSLDRPTLAHMSRLPAHRSLWYASLVRRAAAAPVHDWLVEQANLRGFFGAYGSQSYADSPDPSLELEEVIVGLLAPQAPADGRTLKLVVRMLQSGQVNADRLRHWARRERAEGILYWLLDLVPQEELTPELIEIRAHFTKPPRGHRGVEYAYDPQRLVRRPATRDHLWRTKHG